ncbi:hypothetical protein HHK36_009538 [Tetracentron sinense]|uniref:Uncharacterized protein n=1 Tax=Tetracentron sinense TaxID=13715 RepID=A0A834ZFP1_TETSI|nr:hypothetical protein HHK36_009538 [Tetracentron sinense]
MSKRDPLRPYMDVIDNMLLQRFREDPSFKPQGGRLGENDMDYDTDEKSMATLRRQLRRAREEYYRCKSEYMTYVMEALELEDIIRNYDRRSATGWKYVSSFRPGRTGTLGSFLDMMELVWRCILKKQLEKLLAIVLGCMSVAILLAEATLLLPTGVDLSLFSILINAVGKQEMLVQVYSEFLLDFKSFGFMKIFPLEYESRNREPDPDQTPEAYAVLSLSIAMISTVVGPERGGGSCVKRITCRADMVDPDKNPEQLSIADRFHSSDVYVHVYILFLVQNWNADVLLINAKTNKLSQLAYDMLRMWKIDDAVPIFGRGFNQIYPLIMVVYTLLVASNFFDRVISFFGSWKRFRFQNEADDMDGFDASGNIILQKERSWLEQGRKVGEHVIPLARNFNNMTMDVESASNSTDKDAVEMKATKEGGMGIQSKPLKEETRIYGTSREAISNKYAAIREQQTRQASNMKSKEKNITSATISLLDTGNSQNQESSGNTTGGPSSGLASTWESMKTGFQGLKANIGAKKFLPLRQAQETKLVSRILSSDSLDEIFQRLKRPTVDHRDHSDGDDDGIDIRNLGPTR